LGLNDDCKVVDLYLSGLLKSGGKKFDHWILDISTKGKKNKSILVKSEIFIEEWAKSKCPQSFKLKQNFTSKNISKTLEKFKLKIPKTISECSAIHKKMLSDVKSPYYCSLVSSIKEIPSIERKISKTSPQNFADLNNLKKELAISRKKQRVIKGDAFHYLDNFCSNVSHTELFCLKFFRANGWKKIFSQELNPLYAVPTCMNLVSSTQENKKSGLSCSNKIGANKKVCMHGNSQIKTSFPRPNCHQLQMAFNHSKIKFNRLDCPNRIGNNSIVTINRFLNHFGKYPDKHTSNNKTTSHKKLIDQCSSHSINTFARFNLTVPQSKAWQNQLCFMNKIENKEECFPVIFGSSPDSELSLQTNIDKILNKTKAKDSKTKCFSVLERDYNPNLLQYKSGCHIVIQDDCRINKCQFDIYYNTLKMRHIKPKYGNNFQLFPHTFKDDKLSQLSLLKEETNLKYRNITNLFEYKFHLKNHPNTMVLGVGCREDLLPLNYKRRSFNQCTPESFLIDNYIEEDEIVSFVMYLSMDDITTPRIITWKNLYRSIKGIQKFSPLLNWNLIAFYEK
ncbi:hypothetical protein N9N67_06350, partial [Bacteriovoracaceae bacterium]|nr:hypothetical protein [Bacteriovoracaceae bacterium]